MHPVLFRLGSQAIHSYGVMLMLGFLAVAGFIQHAHDPWPRRELAFLFAVPFLALLLAGAGRFSLDALVRPRWPWSGK